MTGNADTDGGGWPDVDGDTALTVKVPEADPLVRAGAPAHITVLYPFLHVSRVDARVHGELGELFGAHDPFEVSLGEFGRYPGVLFLHPLPGDPVRALTREVTGRWPEAEPYRGVFGGGLEPHLTVAITELPDGGGPVPGGPEPLDVLAAELAPALPVTARITTVHLIVREGTGWRDHTAYSLGRPPSRTTSRTPSSRRGSPYGLSSASAAGSRSAGTDW
ncbi:2'-5' RNA ligase family protein [Streptomyces armeniacus]|uniref:2'-5' RNA ligase family protein n=1 Tax=Streptomyces armeniacus TaxID=83291 RepID=A0A345XYF2_9ACTN|nr:2'-5' RNA ligase family protein [Streptomyces armeniacus]AXK36668.1 2'-5' RNA ligase family protein [Streptomyces armeniacus]